MTDRDIVEWRGDRIDVVRNLKEVLIALGDSYPRYNIERAIVEIESLSKAAYAEAEAAVKLRERVEALDEQAAMWRGKHHDLLGPYGEALREIATLKRQLSERPPKVSEAMGEPDGERKP